MSLFPNKHRPRSCLDLRVGNSHVVEVLLHLRRADWDWYQRNQQDIEEELLELMEKSVIPRMFGELIEQYHAKRNPGLLPPEESTIGSKNKKTAPGGKQKRKPRKGGKKTPSAKENAIKEEKPEKDVYFSFGEILQLAYRRQPLASTRERTLFYKEDGTFRDHPKLPHRLLIWCSKIIDPQQKTNPDPAGFGFFRPEMIPLSSLFREPKDDGLEEE